MDIYNEILSALESEEHVMLATIISTTGSTPASAFSKMLVKQGGVVSVGTVGGGCMEGEVLLHAHRLYNAGKAEILAFHLNEDDIEHGLICGGSLDILIEPVTRHQLSLFGELQNLRGEGTDCVVATVIDSNGNVNHKEIIVPGNSSRQPASHITNHASDFPGLIERTHHRQETQRLKFPEGELILEPVAGMPSLLIFGGGHVSRFVSRSASSAGFSVTIIDDREKYANALRFPEAQKTIVTDYSKAFTRVSVMPSTYLLIVTRGHEYDEVLLECALRTPARYIGMIGSKRKVLTAFNHLMERGIPIEQLKRVYAPVGIEIGAITAEEIAVSIVAQLINIRRGNNPLMRNKSDQMIEHLYLLEKKPSIA